MEKINMAFEFATKKHEGQKRKNINVPYIVHLYEVFQILRTYTNDETTLISGILHDTIEDTNTTLQEIVENFGQDVAEIVDFCSEKDKKRPYLQRKMEHALRMMNAPMKAKLVKCADNISNWTTTLLDLKIGENPWKKFNADKETVKFNYSLSVATFEGLKEKYPEMYHNIIGLFNSLFDEHLQSLSFDEAFQFIPTQQEKKSDEKKVFGDICTKVENADNGPIIKSNEICFKLGNQKISDCRQCPYSVESLDPDPYDWFRDDNTRVDCKQLNRNIVRSLEGFHESVPIPQDCPFVK